MYSLLFITKTVNLLNDVSLLRNESMVYFFFRGKVRVPQSCSEGVSKHEFRDRRDQGPQAGDATGGDVGNAAASAADKCDGSPHVGALAVRAAKNDLRASSTVKKKVALIFLLKSKLPTFQASKFQPSRVIE